VTGKIHVDIPSDVSLQELKEIEYVLAETIADSLGCNPEQIRVRVDPKTGEATFVVKTNDPTFADEMQKILKTKKFKDNVNEGIDDNFEFLPDRLGGVLTLNKVNVNSLF
jgi:hypothetical protein